jgi:hypothetical protein
VNPFRAATARSTAPPYEGDKPSFKANIIEVIKTHQVWTVADGGLLGRRTSTPYEGDKPSYKANLPECPRQMASGRSGMQKTFQRDSMSDGR